MKTAQQLNCVKSIELGTVKTSQRLEQAPTLEQQTPALEQAPALEKAPVLKHVSARTCPLCHESAHLGDSEESFTTLAALNPEAAVFYDRDLAESADASGLCGPRFRQNSGGLHAHYGNPAGARYIVYKWQAEPKLWEKILDIRPTPRREPQC